MSSEGLSERSSDQAGNRGSLDLSEVRHRLPGRHIDWFGSVNSTMTIAAQLARDGCAAGTIVGAEGQLAGVGRHGRVWHSEVGAGLYVSIVLRPPQPHQETPARATPAVMLALGLAVQEAIAQVTQLAPDLRWPNDVLVNGKKCAGILAQIEGDAVITGIGINVNQTVFAAAISGVATSLRLEGASCLRREDLLVAVVEAVERCCKILTEEGAPAIFAMFSRSSSYAHGRRVRVEQKDQVIEGVTCGLDESGFLIVRDDSGKETTIVAGGVRPA
jgi:BirA family biotin operon repressor/biotin-[acetyl-CoA-carboxylase] ligase